MKKPPSVEIQVSRRSGIPVRLRVIAKPSRYHATRYWVILPATTGRDERWLVVATMAQAMKIVAQWLAAEGHDCFAPEPSDGIAGQNGRMARQGEFYESVH
jgi:hypothetical protein